MGVQGEPPPGAPRVGALGEPPEGGRRHNNDRNNTFNTGVSGYMEEIGVVVGSAFCFWDDFLFVGNVPGYLSEHYAGHGRYAAGGAENVR